MRNGSPRLPSSSAAVLTSVRVLRFLLPTDFLMGFYWQLHHSYEGHPASLLGMHSRWVGVLLSRRFCTQDDNSLSNRFAEFARLGPLPFDMETRERLLVLLLPFALYSAFLMMSPIDIAFATLSRPTLSSSSCLVVARRTVA